MNWLRDKIAGWLAPAFERLLPTIKIKEQQPPAPEGGVYYTDGYMPDDREDVTENPFTRNAPIYGESNGDR